VLLVANSAVRAQDRAAAGAAATPDTPLLVAPTNTALTTGVTDPPLGVPTLVWDPVSGATKYQVQIGVSDGFASTVVSIETENSSYAPLLALGNGIFYWRVRAAAGAVWGPYSEVWSFEVDWSAGGLLRPELLSPSDGAVRAAFDHADFSWTPVPGAATYNFQIARDFEMANVVYSVVAVAPHHTPLQRLDGNLYYWRVTPVDNKGHLGAASDVWSFTFNWSTPPELLNPADRVELPFVPRFSWTAVEGAKEYRLQISTQDNFVVYEQIVTRNTDYTPVQALINDRDYFWRVQAVDQRNAASPWSDTRRFRTRWIFQPQQLSPANNSLQLAYPFFSWAPVPGAERYQIQIADNNAFNPKIVDTTLYNVTNYIQPQWTSARVETAYYWRVLAIDAQGNVTPWSETWSFQFSDPTGVLGDARATTPNLVYPLPYYSPDADNMPTHGDRSFAWPLFLWDTAHDVIDPTTGNAVTRVDYYRLEVDNDPDMLSPNFVIDTAGIAAAPTQDHPFTELQEGARYYWQVTAWRNGFEVGSKIKWTTHYNPAVSQLPVTTTAVLIYPDDGFEAVAQPPVLGWLPITGTTHYRVQVARDEAFTTIVDEAAALSVNYVPWQGRLTAMPFGAYWWRVRGEDAGGNPVGDWSTVRRFHLSVELAIGNVYDFPPPEQLVTDSTGRTQVARSADGPGNAFALYDLHIVVDRQLRNPNQHWVIAFTTGAATDDAVRYALYFDTDHVEGSGGASDPLGNTTIAIDPLYRPEYVVYVNKVEGGMVSATFYRWTGSSWAPGQAIAALGGEVHYYAQQSIQLFIPYTALGSADSHWVGSLALTVFSLDPAANTVHDTLPDQSGGVANPVLVSNMLLPVYPFETPMSNPIVHEDMPPLRWRMPTYGVDGYQVQVARDAQFTNIVETWESYETGTITAFTLMPTTFQSKIVYANNESYYWRVRPRHEKFLTSGGGFDYGPWSPALRFKLDSRRVENARLSTGVDAFMTPTFLWDRVEGAAGYTIQIDDDSNFSSPLVNQATDATSFTPLDTGAAALFPGVQYHWRVVMRRSQDVIGHWTTPITFTKSSLSPLVVAPLDGITVTSQPTLRWMALLTPSEEPRLAAPAYQVQIANNVAFNQPRINTTTQATSYTPAKAATLPDGDWWWRVAFVDANGKVGPYSQAIRFTKKYAAPMLYSPPPSTTVTNIPNFSWQAIDGAAYYKVDYATNAAFNGATSITTDMTNTLATKAMPYSTYHWRVQMFDADRNPGQPRQGMFYYYLPASFIVSPSTAIAPSTVIFTDTSTGTLQSWRWDFGDGQTSTLRNPSHTYAAGAYTVTLQNVTADNYTRTVTITNAVQIYQRVSARFSAAPTLGPAPLSVKFSDQSTGSITRWLWNFGNGATSTEISPTHVYTQPGSYQVVLSVSGPGGVDVLVRQAYISVTVPSGTPTPSATPTTSRTPTATATATSSATATPTPTPTATATPLPSHTPTTTKTPTATATTTTAPVSTATSSATPQPTQTATVTAPTATSTNTPTATGTPTPTASITAAPTTTPTATPTATSTAPGPLLPVIVSIVPNQQEEAQSIVAIIGGANFLAGAQVFFGQLPAQSVTLINSGQLVVLTPPGLAPGVWDVRVCNPGAQCGVLTDAFTVIAAAAPTATITPTPTPSSTPTATPTATATPPPAPTITHLSPDHQQGATPIIVIVAGANFMAGAQVFFGDAQAQDVSFINSSQLAALTPGDMAAGACDVRVCNPDQQCSLLPGAFSVIATEPLHSIYLPAVQR